MGQIPFGRKRVLLVMVNQAADLATAGLVHLTDKTDDLPRHRPRFVDIPPLDVMISLGPYVVIGR